MLRDLIYPPLSEVRRACNTEEDCTCRTIKANYFKSGRINFQYQNDWGATGVMTIYETI